MENLATIKNNLILSHSELFKAVYENAQLLNETHAFNEVSINNIDDLYYSLLTKYNELNKAQINCLQLFFKSLEYVLFNIDPNKLNIKNDLIENTDLMLWRESSQGITKLIFDEFGQVVYIFNGNDGTKQKGIFDETVDMEKLLYRFISM